MSPSEVRSSRDQLALKTCEARFGQHWALVQHDGRIYLRKQQQGMPPEGEISIPARTFAAIVDWYLRKQ